VASGGIGVSERIGTSTWTSIFFIFRNGGAGGLGQASRGPPMERPGECMPVS
jgi:hypothetical protein